jgi:NADPH:quinone reductase-like Zn-dependent oxidoreductase
MQGAPSSLQSAMCITAAGALPIATTRSQTKVAALLDAGAKFVINTKQSKLVDEVKRLTDGKGANIIFDPVVGSSSFPRGADRPSSRGGSPVEPAS